MEKKHYYVVAAVVEHDGKILCMQRPMGQFSYTSLHWEFPGGKVEAGETPQEALHRELLEEMDYDVRVGEYITTVKHVYPDFMITMTAYWCEASTKDFNRKEHADHKWLTKEQLDTLDWCAADVPIVEAISCRRKSCNQRVNSLNMTQEDFLKAREKAKRIYGVRTPEQRLETIIETIKAGNRIKERFKRESQSGSPEAK